VTPRMRIANFAMAHSHCFQPLAVVTRDLIWHFRWPT